MSEGIVPRILAEFPRWMAMLILWRKKDRDLRSPVQFDILLPRSKPKVFASFDHPPKQSTAKATKWYILQTVRYRFLLFTAALSAAKHDCLEEPCKYDKHSGSTQVASHASWRPRLQGTMVTPSTLFLLSSREISTGSKWEGISAVDKARLINSFKAEWRENLPALLRHFRPWCPNSSAIKPQRQVCVLYILAPRRSATAILRVSGSRSVPRLGDGTARSQSPDSFSGY